MLQIRPAIDIHNGSVKQIVGATLSDEKEAHAIEHFVGTEDACAYAGIFHAQRLTGGHIILLNKKDTPAYEDSKKAALSVLQRYPDTWQIGGGITPDNAGVFLDAGASHVIATSFVFYGGRIDEERLAQLKQAVGKDRLILDLSCKKVEENGMSFYRIATDRWTKVSEEVLSVELMERLYSSCAGFLVHAADVEGRLSGIEEGVLDILSKAAKTLQPAGEENIITYAGGVHTLEDIGRIKTRGKGKVDVTVGSALSLYGGTLALSDVVNAAKK